MKLTVREAAKFLDVSEKTVYRWAAEGEIPVYRVNGQYRFNQAELLEWATARNLKISTAVLPKIEPVASVADALKAGGVFHGIGGTDPRSILRAMVDAVKLPDRVDRELVFEMLAARGGLGATAVGNGVAIPHMRNPLVLDLPDAAIFLFFLRQPLELATPDGRPIHALFWVVSPTIQSHMVLLSRLAAAIRAPGFQAALAAQASAEEIMTQARRMAGGTGAP